MLFAIEHFARRIVRGPSLYMAFDVDDGDEDKEWDPKEDEHNQYENDHDNDNDADDNGNDYNESSNESEEEDYDYDDEDVSDMDCQLDRSFFWDSDSDYDSDYNNTDFQGRPKVYHTPLFDTMYPALTENEKYFKLSNLEFQYLCSQVNSNGYSEFWHGSEKILKDAMFRFILVESLKN